MIINLFSPHGILAYSQEQIEKIDNYINELEANTIFNLGERQFVEALISKHSVEYPIIDKDSEFIVSNKEVYISTNEIKNPSYYSRVERKVKTIRYVFGIPYTGDIRMLQYFPSRPSGSGVNEKLVLDEREKLILLEVTDVWLTPSPPIKQMVDNFYSKILPNYLNLKPDIEQYNNSLEGHILKRLDIRKQWLLRQNSILQGIGVPLRRRNDVSQTFNIPSPELRKKVIIERPHSSSNVYYPEPSLSDINYRDLLKMINDIGKCFELYPSTYHRRSEPHLRDLILLILSPNFVGGSATGETFSVNGKTDIMLKYESSVAFVSECKKWKGENEFTKCIDQLLSYLTWRNSKASIVLFVKEKDITNILEKVKATLSKHKHYVKIMPATDESWFNYIFSLPVDKQKEIKLAVQVYHIPNVESTGSIQRKKKQKVIDM